MTQKTASMTRRVVLDGFDLTSLFLFLSAIGITMLEYNGIVPRNDTIYVLLLMTSLIIFMMGVLKDVIIREITINLQENERRKHK